MQTDFNELATKGKGDLTNITDDLNDFWIKQTDAIRDVISGETVLNQSNLEKKVVPKIIKAVKKLD